MSAKRTRHVGATSIFNLRERLLQEFEFAKRETVDDPVKTKHGDCAELIYREHLEQILPARFGVTKGYIITSDQSYAEDLIEWDIIIYDKFQSPTLFVRSEDGTKRRGIPIPYVLAAIEVKSRLTKASAETAGQQLARLRKLEMEDSDEETEDSGEPSTVNPHQYLRSDFKTMAVFFELDPNMTKEDFEKALGGLLQAGNLGPHFAGGLILSAPEIRGACSLGLQFANTEELFSLLPPPAVAGMHFSPVVLSERKMVFSFDPNKNPTAAPDQGLYMRIAASGFGINEYQRKLFELVEYLNNRPTVESLNSQADEIAAPPDFSLLDGYGVDTSANELKSPWPDENTGLSSSEEE